VCLRYRDWKIQRVHKVRERFKLFITQELQIIQISYTCHFEEKLWNYCLCLERKSGHPGVSEKDAERVRETFTRSPKKSVRRVSRELQQTNFQSFSSKWHAYDVCIICSSCAINNLKSSRTLCTRCIYEEVLWFWQISTFSGPLIWNSVFFFWYTEGPPVRMYA
jgi:hypothetical protein